MTWKGFYRHISLRHVSLLLRQAVLLGLNFYQSCLRPMFATGCYFYPSCSTYAQEMIRHRGICSSLVPILMRILRCHPWGKDGKLQCDDPLERG